MIRSMMDTVAPSREFNIDAEIEAIVGKLASGTASKEDRTKLAELGARRVRMMRRSSSRARQAA